MPHTDLPIEKHEQLNGYTSRHPWIYGNKDEEKDPAILIKKLQNFALEYGGNLVIKDPSDMKDKDVEEIIKQYSYGKIADRHLDATEFLRLKKARKTQSTWQPPRNLRENTASISLKMNLPNPPLPPTMKKLPTGYGN